MSIIFRFFLADLNSSLFLYLFLSSNLRFFIFDGLDILESLYDLLSHTIFVFIIFNKEKHGEDGWQKKLLVIINFVPFSISVYLIARSGYCMHDNDSEADCETEVTSARVS